MTSIIYFLQFFAAILSICFSFPTNRYEFKYKLGDDWIFDAQMKNLPPGGQTTVFITYYSDTLGKANSTEYTIKDSVSIRHNLTYDGVFVEVELRTKAGLCTKQRILEGYIATSQHWMFDLDSSKILLGDASCSGGHIQNFSVAIDFKGECNDNVLFGLINWSSTCKVLRGLNVNGISGTSNATSACNTDAITEKIPELNPTCFNEGNSDISTSSSLKMLVLPFGIIFVGVLMCC